MTTSTARKPPARRSRTAAVRTLLALAALTLLPAPAAPAALAGSGEIELREVPYPAIDYLEEPDRLQVEEERSELDALLAAEDTPAAELADRFGHVGRLYFLFDLMGAAEPALWNAAELAPEELAWHYTLAALHQREGHLERELARLERVLELRPDHLGALVRRGRALIVAGRLDEAEESFRKVLRIDPDSAAAHAGIGKVAYERKDFDTAVARLERALALQPEATTLHHQLGLAYRAAGAMDEARSHLTQAGPELVYFPDPLIDGLGELVRGPSFHRKRGDRAMERGQIAVALQEYRTAAEADPEDAGTQYNLGYALVQSGAEEEGLEHFRRAVELDPEFRDAHYNLAAAMVQRERWDEAVVHYEAVHRLDPLDYDAHLELALALDRAGQGARAAEEVQKLLAEVETRNTPLEGRARLLLASLLERAGRPRSALDEYREAAELLPDSGPAQASYAVLLGRAGRFAEAAERYGRAIELAPEDLDMRFGQAMALLFAEDYAAARDRLADGIGRMPESIPLIHLQARLLATCPDESVRDGERALELATRAFRAQQSLPHAETLAMALAETGRFDQAIELQGQVVEALEANAQAGPVERSRRRLALYREGKPCRAPWLEGLKASGE